MTVNPEMNHTDIERLLELERWCTRLGFAPFDSLEWGQAMDMIGTIVTGGNLRQVKWINATMKDSDIPSLPGSINYVRRTSR